LILSALTGSIAVMKKGLMVQLRWALVIGVFSLITACRSTGGNDEDALATDGETMGRMDREFSSGGVSEEIELRQKGVPHQEPEPAEGIQDQGGEIPQAMGRRG
jgi:hypothetical protein